MSNTPDDRARYDAIIVGAGVIGADDDLSLIHI